MIRTKADFVQVVKFLFAGLLTNGIIYAVYLLLTVVGIGHKTAMTLLFAAGMMLSYNMNKRWTFAHPDARDETLWRFITAYLSAYALNFVSMWVAVDRMGIPHYIVQAVNIVVISALLFLVQKYWIFALRPSMGGEFDNGGR